MATFAQNPVVLAPGGFGTTHDYSIACTAGNTVVLMIIQSSAITAVDLLGASGALSAGYIDGNNLSYQYKNLPSGVTGIRVTTTGPETDRTVVVFELTGEADFDVGATMSSSFGTSVTATVTTTGTDDVLVARWPTGGNTLTPSAGYAASSVVNNTVAEYNSSALGAPGSETISGTFSGSASYSGFAVAYKDASGGGGADVLLGQAIL